MASDIFKTVDGLKKGIDDLQRQLAGLQKTFGRAARREVVRGSRAAGKAVRKAVSRARKESSSQVKNMRKLQGRYMGLVRNLNKSQKAQVKKIKQSKGYKAAFELASRLGKK
jgi:soluble cytochrome b562